jgi:hypothetical protein
MKKIEDMVWFRISFDPIVWISLKQQYFIAATLSLRAANSPPKLVSILFLPWFNSGS